MSATSLALWAVVGLIAGFALGWLVAALRAQQSEKRLSVELEVTRSQLRNQQSLEEDRGLMIERAQERLKNAFDTLATDSLRSNSELFLKLARENLGQQQLQALHSLKEREQAIEALLAPIREALKRTETQISTIEKDRHEAFGAIRQHLE
jgi:DNA recombination protein RmuC